ncbi:alpha/beta hydrolase [Subtercola vilae]|nr:alpha/beta hydrolase [Subtercola vilae]
MTYLTHDVPVASGLMRVGEWRPDEVDAPVILALHGMTSTHHVWSTLAEQLPDVRIIAPDLRGRGLSNDLTGPYGVAQHTSDARAVMRALGITRATVLGHSLGAFVAVELLARDAAESSTGAAGGGVFERGVLVDGGLPVTVPLNHSEADLLEAVLGAGARGFTLSFADRAMNRKFWSLHPALSAAWSPALAAYADTHVTEYLTAEGAIELQLAVSPDALAADSRELFGSTAARAALDRVRVPLTVLTAGRGLLNESPGVYTPREIDGWKLELPHVRFVELHTVNHYTTVLGEQGVAALAHALQRTLLSS